MNILLIHNSYLNRGGEDQVFLSEQNLIISHGHSVERYIRENIDLVKLSSFQRACVTIWNKDAKREIHELKPVQAIHVHNSFPLLSPSIYFAIQSKGVPVVQTLHNYRLLCPNALLMREGRVCEDCLGKGIPWPGVWHACYRNSRAATAVTAAMLTLHRALGTYQNKVDVYIALTEFSRRKFIEGGLPANKIVVKPNFVSADPGPRKGGGDFALFVGRLSPEKGVHTLLKAWHTLSSVPLKLAGEGPLLDELRAFVNQNSFNQVELLGRRAHDSVLELMKSARFLVLPSECYENFPMTIAEAYACGVPVIASRLGAMEELVHDGVTGLHFTAGDSDDLAEKVIWAWDHPQEMEAMGKNARQEYEQKYTAERNYQLLMQIYQRAIDSKKKSKG